MAHHLPVQGFRERRKRKKAGQGLQPFREKKKKSIWVWQVIVADFLPLQKTCLPSVMLLAQVPPPTTSTPTCWHSPVNTNSEPRTRTKGLHSLVSGTGRTNPYWTAQVLLQKVQEKMREWRKTLHDCRVAAAAVSLPPQSLEVCCISWQLAQVHSRVCLNFNGIEIKG